MQETGSNDEDTKYHVDFKGGRGEEGPRDLPAPQGGM